MDFARPKEPKLVDCDLREVLEKTLLLLSPQAHTLGVEIRKEIPQKPFWISIDPDQMRQAFTNLGVNALESMPQGGIFRVVVTEKVKGRVLIRFSDTGEGIPKEFRTRIFDPFFTTKEPDSDGHGGSGWSLSWGSSAIAARKAMALAGLAGGPPVVAVIGSGALGLTSALQLQRMGARVTIYARERAAFTRSMRATGSWTPDSRIADADRGTAVPDPSCSRHVERDARHDAEAGDRDAPHAGSVADAAAVAPLSLRSCACATLTANDHQPPHGDMP